MSLVKRPFFKNRGTSSGSKIVESPRDSVRLCVDLACTTARGDLVVTGWISDPTRQVRNFYLSADTDAETRRGRLLQHGVDGVSLVRISRPDVAHALGTVTPEHGGDRHGFVLLIPGYPKGAAVELLLQSERRLALPLLLATEPATVKRTLESGWQHSGPALMAALRQSVDEADPLFRLALSVSEEIDGEGAGADRTAAAAYDLSAPVRYFIELALEVDGGLVLVGWATAGDADMLELHSEAQRSGKQAVRFADTDGLTLIRTFRPDLKAALSVEQLGRGMHGFALYWPMKSVPAGPLTVGFKRGDHAQSGVTVFKQNVDLSALISPIWLHSGDALRSIARQLPDQGRFADALCAVEAERYAHASHKFAACDHAILLSNRVLVLSGWIGKRSDEIERIELVSGDCVLDCTANVRRYLRPDLQIAFPGSAGTALGFLLVIGQPDQIGCNAKLSVVCRNGQRQVLRPQVEVMDWLAFGRFLSHQAALAEPLLGALGAVDSFETEAEQLNERIAWIRRELFQVRYPHLPTQIEQPETVMAAVDRAYPLGDDGLLIFGWCATPRRQPASISVLAGDGDKVEITGTMFPLLRADVGSNYRARFPEVGDWSGFVCLAPLPTRAGEARALCFDFGSLGEVWLKIPTELSGSEGKELIREILGTVPAPDRMRHSLHALFSSGLGKAIESVSRSRPKFSGEVSVRQYGAPADTARISVVVPLYGRFDFLRYQLAQFADDPDFADVDLIYVVDDPAIVSPTLELAAKYQALFRVPFRVLWYGRNLGFAGANNVGARFARGDDLVLLNSDVIPQRAGWLSTLQSALHALPEAGAVGPLLQFGDGSIQHAGMYPRSDALLPGFLLNAHKGMGTAWTGGDEPSEHPMLTAACLMIRKHDYDALGGFDEGYVIGDYEDSDLCLALRKRGKRLWLAPAARLWHLERQSQTLGDLLGQREMVTLFNGWRYHEKIRTGQLAAPTAVEVQQ